MGDEDAVDPADAFAALGDPLRIDIVRALAAQRRESPAADGLGFAALRKQVDVRDSGRFRYHLEQLQEIFVEQRDDA
jgi:DNA-binding transcriptional ArsR family regulator